MSTSVKERTWYHGTAAHLASGDLITPGHEPNFEESNPRRVFFTADPAWALMYAIRIVAMFGTCGHYGHVYEVRPLASRTFRDRNRFWGELADRRARWSAQPVEVVSEVTVSLATAKRALRLTDRMGQIIAAQERDLEAMERSLP